MDPVTHLRKDESQPVIVIDNGEPGNENGVNSKDTKDQDVENQVIKNAEDQEDEEFQVIKNTEDQENEEFQVTKNTEDQEDEEFQVIINTEDQEDEEFQVIKNTEDQENEEFQVIKNTEDQENEEFQVIDNTEDQVYKNNISISDRESEEVQFIENTDDQENEEFQVIKNIEDQENQEFQVIDNTEDQERDKYQVYKNNISISDRESEEVQVIENTEDQENEEFQVIGNTEDQERDKYQVYKNNISISDRESEEVQFSENTDDQENDKHQVFKNDTNTEEHQIEEVKINNSQGQESKENEVKESTEDQQKDNTEDKKEEDQVKRDDEDEDSEDEGDEPRLVMECESDGCPDIYECDNDKGLVVYDSSAPQQLTNKIDDEGTSTSEPLHSKSDGDWKKETATDEGSKKQVTDRKTKRKPRRVSQPTVNKIYRCNRCVYESIQYSDYVLHNCKPPTRINFTVTYHSDGNIFSCTCGHIYHKLKTFHEHLVTHMIPKPYRCSLCKEVFSTRKEIMKHLTAVHPKDEMRFYVNGLKFTQNILDKARKNGSYTQHFDKNKSKSLDGVNNKTESGPPKNPSLNTSLNKPHDPSTTSTPRPSTSKISSPPTSKVSRPSTSKISSSSTSKISSPSTSKISSLSTSKISSLSTSKISSPSTSKISSLSTSKISSPSTSKISSPSTSKISSPSTSDIATLSTSKFHSLSFIEIPSSSNSISLSSEAPSLSIGNTVSSTTSITSRSSINTTPKPLACKSVSLLNSKNFVTSATKQLKELLVKRTSKIQSSMQSASRVVTCMNQKVQEDVIIIDDDDDDDVVIHQKDNVSSLQDPMIGAPHPVGLFKNMGQPGLFKFHFSSCGVKYSCTFCKKEWESRSHFCFHIWHHQHENEQKCSECDQKTGESGVSCMKTIRLFRKLAFASFTKVKQAAESAGALKDLALNQVAFCKTNNIPSYKCLDCNVDLPQLSNLKWHVWQHSHSSIICPACSIMGAAGTRYIVCPLVEKLVSKIRKNEEQYYYLKLGMAGLTAQAMDSGAMTSSSVAESGQKFGMIKKKNETLFVCYICSKQWTNKQTFWLHVWTHYHKDRQLCQKCKKIDGFPGMKCSMVDKEMDIPDFHLTNQVVETEEFTRLEEDMIITSNDPDNRPQEDHDIIIIDDTPGPGETDANLNIINIDEESEEPLNDSSASLTASNFQITTNAKAEESLEEDEAEVIIDKADVTVSDVSFSTPSTSEFSSEMASASTTDINPQQILVLNPEHNLFIKCTFPEGIIRSILTEPNVSKAISRFFCVHRNEFMCLICKSGSFALNQLIDLYEHILVQHMKIPLVQCGYCDFNANKEHKIRSHSLNKHSGKEISIVKYQLNIFDSVEEYSRLIVFIRSRNLPKDYVENKFLSSQLDALKQTGNSACDSNESVTIVKENQDSEPAELDVKFKVECNDTQESGYAIDAAGPLILSAYSLASEEKVSEFPPGIKPEIETLTSNGQEYFNPNFYACGSCTYSTLIMEDLRKHLLIKHCFEKNFTCKHCGFVGLRIDQLLKHFLHHTNYNSLNMPVFQCIDNNCEYRCNNLEGFLSHLETHNLKQFECHECAETMDSLKELGQHLKLNLLFIYSCPYCSAVATNSEKMKEHIESYHDGAIPQEWTIGKQLVCRDRQLYNYYSKFNLETQKSNPTSTIVADEELNCKLCSFYGVNAAELKSHGEVHTQIQKDGAFICPFCAVPFDSPKHLTDHVMKHAETQMSVYFFTCKIDNYCTNVYQKILQHIHDGQHVLSDKPEDMFDYRQVTYKSQVICCPRCPFKSACRGYLTCHIERVHNGNVGAVHSKGYTSADSSSEIILAQTKMLNCPEENCTFCTTDSKILHEHIKTHSDISIATELAQRSPDRPFSDINTLKKSSHIYIPTDGPDDQENFHLLETRLKPVYFVGKESYKCKICKIHKQEQVQMIKHLLTKHVRLQYSCFMCQFSSSMIWRMQKHGRHSHNCLYFNIIYSDKIEEVIKQIRNTKPKKTNQKPKDDENESEDVSVTERRVRECQQKQSKQNKPNESQKAKSFNDVQQNPKIDKCSIKPSVELPSVELKKRGRKRKESTEQIKAAELKKPKTVRNTEGTADDPISLPKPKNTQQLPPTEADKITSATDKNICLLGSEYLDSSLSVLYKTEDNRHQCHVCKEWFPAVTRYWIHHHLNLIHLKLRLYKCGYCKWRALEKFKIHQHISKFHPKEGIKVHDADVDISEAVTLYIKKNKLNLKLPVVKEANDNSVDTSSASSSSSSNIKRYRCEHCQETFKYIIKAKIHANSSHFGLEPNIMVIYKQATVTSSTETPNQTDKSIKRKSSDEPDVLNPKKSKKPVKQKPKKPVEQLYKCPQCSFYTDVDLDAMLSHFKSHNYEKIIECSTCGVRSFDDSGSKKHNRLCHQDQPQKSNLLPVINFFKIIKPEDAPTSMLACNSINKQFKFECTYCHLKSDVDNAMRDHLLQHLEKLKPHIVCSVCSVPVPEIVHRKHHFKNVHSSIDNKKNLDMVHKALNDELLDCLQEGTLKEEPEPNSNFMCMRCPLKFQTLSSLGVHYKSFHRLTCGINTFWKDKITGCVFNFLGTMCKNSPKIVDLSKFDVFLCRACDFRTNNKDLLYNHQRANHQKKYLNRTMELCYSRDETPSTSSGPKYLSFRCPVCPEISKSLSEYSEHISCHGNIFKKLKPSESNIVRCRNCTFVSDSVAKIYDHVKTHATLKQFVCAYCSFEANQSTVVKLHLKSAHPNKTLTGSIIDLKSPRLGHCVDFSSKVKLKNFFEMSLHEFEHLLNSAHVQDVDLSKVPLEIAEKLLLAH